MRPLRRSPGRRGFSLIELMVGMAIGLICTLVIAMVLASAEGNRRGTTTGGDAQVAGGLAMYTVQRDVASSGYGFASEANAVGCLLQARFKNAVLGVFPPRLAPVLITPGGATGNDQIRVLSSSKGMDPARNSYIGFTVPLRVELAGAPPGVPGYTAGDQAYGVATEIGFAQGDLVVAVVDPATPPAAERPCEMFEVNAPVVAGSRQIPRLDDAERWNPADFPANTALPATASTTGAFLVNLGSVVDHLYRINAQMRLERSRLDTANLQREVTEIQGGIVRMRAMYGRDTNADGAVDRYDYVQPTSSAEWQQVLALRLALVARSQHYEKEEVTPSDLQWDVGSAIAVAGASACGSSYCVPMALDQTGSDWKHYRYKLFDTVVPLRNQRHKSGRAI